MVSIPKDFDSRNPNLPQEIRSEYRKWVKIRHFEKMADFRFTMVYTRSGAFEGSFPMFSRSADSLMTPEVAYGHRKWALGTGNGCSRYFPRAQKQVECLYLRFRTRWIHSWHRQWSLGTGSGPNIQEAGTVIPGAGVSHK